MFNRGPVSQVAQRVPPRGCRDPLRWHLCENKQITPQLWAGWKEAFCRVKKQIYYVKGGDTWGFDRNFPRVAKSPVTKCQFAARLSSSGFPPGALWKPFFLASTQTVTSGSVTKYSTKNHNTVGYFLNSPLPATLAEMTHFSHLTNWWVTLSTGFTTEGS